MTKALTFMFSYSDAKDASFDGYLLSLNHQEDSVWLFTAKKFDASSPNIVQVNYGGFSEGSGTISNLIQ